MKIYVLVFICLLQAVCYGQYVTEIDDCIRNGVNVTAGSNITQNQFSNSTCGFIMQANRFIVVQPILVNISEDARIRLFLISGNGSAISKTLIHEYFSRHLFRNLIFVADGNQKFALVVLTKNASQPIGQFTFVFRTNCYIEMAAEDFPSFNSPNYYPRNPALINGLIPYNGYVRQCYYRIYSRYRNPFSVKFYVINMAYYANYIYLNNANVQQRTTYTFDGMLDVYMNYTYYDMYSNLYGFNGSVDISFDLQLVPLEESTGLRKGIPRLQTLGQNISFQYGSLRKIDAQIMCINLGFGGLDSIFQVKNSTDTNLIFHEFQCLGPEKRLSQCVPITRRSAYFRTYLFRKVRPTGISCTENFPIRLVYGDTNSSGYVQVKVAGNWGYICAYNMDQYAGDVLCRELGFKGVLDVSSNYYTYYSDTVMNNLRCGSNTRLKDCYYQTTITYTDYLTNYYRETYDYYNNEYGTYRINPNFYNYYYYSACYNGAIRLTCRENTSFSLTPEHFKGYFMINDGLVCDNSYTERNAEVYCRALGYPGVWRTSYNGSINSNNYTKVNLRCSGSESSPAFCPMDSNFTCPNNRLAGVICQNVALVGGSFPNEGRVEVFYNGRRGLLCDDNFDLYDGNVICRQLGFLYAERAITTAAYTYGYGNGIFLLNNLYCGGNEESINQCRSTGWGQQSCGGYESAGLICVGNTPQCALGNVTSDNILSSNGSATVFGANPWQARLIPSSVNEWCSATIINRNWLITSANCFTMPTNNFYVTIISSSTYWNSYNWGYTSQIQSLFIHPSYSDVTGDYNIALIKLYSTISYNNYVSPVCLPSSNFTFNGTQCKTTGWIHRSSSSYRPLMGKPVEIKSSDYCMSHTQFDDSQMSRYLCSENNMEPSAVFNGESGGPLVCSIDGRNTLVGVVARSISGARATSIRLFSRVDYYLDWINRTISQN